MKCVVLAAIAIAAVSVAQAQDTLSVHLGDVQTQFVSQNLDLIAQKYGVDVADAGVLQAKLFSNPSFTVSHELYSGEKKRFFDTGSGAEYSVQLQQLFAIAGRRHNQIAVARTESDISKLSYYDLMRSLKFQVSSTFYQLYFLEQTELLFSREESSIGGIVKAYREQRAKGNIAEKDLLRMVALQESLSHQKLEVSAQIAGLQHDMNILLHTSRRYYRPIMESGWDKACASMSMPALGSLIDSAMANRPDVRMASANVQLSEQNLRLQRSLAFSDVAVAATFDKIGAPSKNFIGLSATFDLPLLNRNQGSIRAAKASISMAETQKESQASKALEEVVQSYNTFCLYLKATQNSDLGFMESYKRIADAAQTQYFQKNMNLLEFLDLYDSYKENCIQWNDKWMKLLIAKEELNYQVGTAAIK